MPEAPPEGTAAAIREAERPGPDRPFNRVQRIWKATPEYYLDPWGYYVEFIRILKRRGARFLTMSGALRGDHDPQRIDVLLDHHIDHYPVETEVMCRWELAEGVVSNVYLFNRVVNPFTDQQRLWRVEDLNVALYRELERRGFEIGYHQNAVGRVRNTDRVPDYDTRLSKADVAAAKRVFAEDVQNLRKYFDIRTFIPHGGGEANAELVDLPPEGADLAWVYNNNRRGGRCEPPIAWKNYTDSCGQTTQVVRGYGAAYLLHVANLHLKAWLMEPGLHHVLLHPGRYAKGMPYELDEWSGAEPDDTLVHLTFDYPADPEALPVRSSRTIAEWEGPEGAARRGSAWAARRDVLPIPAGPGGYYLLTDDASVLRNHMAANDLCAGCLVVHEKMTPAQKRELKREKQDSRRPVSLPVPPDRESHDDQARIDRLFRDQFFGFYNTVYVKDSLRHLHEMPLIFDTVHLHRVQVERRRQVRDLVEILDRYRDAGGLSIGCRSSLPVSVWRRMLKAWPGLDEHYDVAVEGDRKQTRALVQSRRAASVSTPQPRRVPDQGRIRRALPNRPPPGGPLRAYLHAAALIWSGQFRRSDIEPFREAGVGDELLESVREDIGRTPYDAPAVYGRFVNHRPDADLLLKSCAGVMHATLRTGLDKPEHAAQQYAWPWAYAAQAAVQAYAATGDLRFADLVLDDFDQVAAARDSEHDRRDDLRGRVLESWGTSFYGEYARMKGYDSAPEAGRTVWNCSVTAAGRITYPAAELSRELLGRPGVPPEYTRRAREALAVARAAIDEFVADYRVTDRGEGYFWRLERDEPEPLNHQNSAGKTLLVLGELLDEPRYLEMAAGLARYFRRAMSLDENDAYVWGYYGFNGPPGRRSQKIEDVAHAHLNLHFAALAHRHGVVFDEEDMARIARTFTKNVYRGDKQFLGGISPQRTALQLKPHYPQHLLGWIVLEQFDPRVRAILEEAVACRYDLYPENWFTGTVGPIAYARRLAEAPS